MEETKFQIRGPYKALGCSVVDANGTPLALIPTDGKLPDPLRLKLAALFAASWSAITALRRLHLLIEKDQEGRVVIEQDDGFHEQIKAILDAVTLKGK